MNKARPPVVRDNTAQEEAALRRQIAEDPDTWEKQSGAPFVKRGRPPGLTKTQVTVRLDNEVLAALKRDGAKGWQTRLNALARKVLGL